MLASARPGRGLPQGSCGKTRYHRSAQVPTVDLMVRTWPVFVTVVAAMLSVACASPARASVLAEHGDAPDGSWTLSYSAAAGERNVFTARRSLDAIVFNDATAPISSKTPHAPCAQQSVSRVSCSIPDEDQDWPRVVISLNDQDDVATVDLRRTGVYSTRISGGSGNDRLALRANPESDTGSNEIKGDAGNDYLSSRSDTFTTMYGGTGADRLSGGPGNDYLNGGPGRDDLKGGAGTDDTVEYSTKAAVTVSLDGRANDGMPGERDWVHADVESASITRGTVVGNARDNSLSVVGPGVARGGGAADSLSGGRGARLYGETGNDKISSTLAVAYGGPGNDEIAGDGVAYGGPGNDSLAATGGRYDGGAGGDRIEKGSEALAATLVGGTGNDHIDSRDVGDCYETPEEETECSATVVKDRIFCGPGTDTVLAGKRDVVARDCERITRER